MDDPSSAALSRAMDAGEREFQELADFAPVLIWRAGLDKLCDWFNKPWLEFVGRPMEQEVGFGWAEGVHPDDFDRCVAIYTSSFDARAAFTMEYRLRRHDGAYRWVLDNGAPFFRNGEFAGYFGSCVDVTAHHEAESKQRLLIDELRHRVQNTLTIVQAIARQSFRNERTTDEVRDIFYDRLQALSAAHSVLTRRNWEAAPLKELLADALFQAGSEERIRFRGDDVRLSPNKAVSLALAAHELCTNAMKYGALSTDQGHIDVEWTVTPEPDSRLHLVWSESGGPTVAYPETRGFGSRLLERGLASELNGSVQLAFEPAGVVCTIDAPLGDPRVPILDLVSARVD